MKNITLNKHIFAVCAVFLLLYRLSDHVYTLWYQIFHYWNIQLETNVGHTTNIITIFSSATELPLKARTKVQMCVFPPPPPSLPLKSHHCTLHHFSISLPLMWGENKNTRNQN